MNKGQLSAVVELPTFLSGVDGLLSSTEKTALIDYLARNPEKGDEIPRTGGLRKLRWGSKGKGKKLQKMASSIKEDCKNRRV